MRHTLQISNLHVSIDDTPIMRGIDLTVGAGELHAIMGPNGSGKSTLGLTLAGHPEYTVTGGSVRMTSSEDEAVDLLELSPDERAQAGLFLAFQYPVEVPGVTVRSFLRRAHEARFAEQPEKQIKRALDFFKHLDALAEKLAVNPALLERGLNEGFSGGEKKRLEILQLALLEPHFAILDETDSGLDVDAIKAVAAGIKTIQAEQELGVIVITHYQRILEYLEPDYVHVLVGGVIEQSGGAELAGKIDSTGYST